MDQRDQTERPMRREPQQMGGDSIAQARRVMDQLESKINSAYRVPMKRGLCIVDAGELVDLIGQLRIVLPHTVVQAQAILKKQDEIIEQAKTEADRVADKADKYYQDKVSQADVQEKEINERADAYDREKRQKANEETEAIIADANVRAEQIIFAAHEQSQKMVDESEISRRAQAFAMETRERAQKDADSIYNQACVHVDKMLSGATAALSRSANELAAARDSLLGQGVQPNR